MNLLALDIGGANIKAAHGVISGGRVGDVRCLTRPFALWKEPNQLAWQIECLAKCLPRAQRLRITMTGELCDCFATRVDGVRHILDAVDAIADNRPVEVWSLNGGFVSISQARRAPYECASANWHVLASWVADLFPQGMTLLIDVGSTTTDIIPLRDGEVASRGRTDMERLESGELIYIGADRTPLCALSPTIQLGHRRFRVMAELFATTADLAVVCERREEDFDNTDTADGRPMTSEHAAARIARMVGADLGMIDLDDAREIARSFDHVLESRIAGAIRQVLGDQSPRTIVISGSGASIAANAARAAGAYRTWLERLDTTLVERASVDVIDLNDRIGRQASQAACAYALLQLGHLS